jgi:flagellar biosynthetic protein FliR
LNLFAVGFPITLVFGLLIILAGLPAMQATFTHLLTDTFNLLHTLITGAAHG